MELLIFRWRNVLYWTIIFFDAFVDTFRIPPPPTGSRIFENLNVKSIPLFYVSFSAFQKGLTTAFTKHCEITRRSTSLKSPHDNNFHVVPALEIKNLIYRDKKKKKQLKFRINDCALPRFSLLNDSYIRAIKKSIKSAWKRTFWRGGSRKTLKTNRHTPHFFAALKAAGVWRTVRLFSHRCKCSKIK